MQSVVIATNGQRTSNMRARLFSSVVIATCMATSAFAADLPTRPAPAPVVYVPAFTWAGFYVGLNAGFGWADSGDVIVNGPTAATSGILTGGGGDGVFVGGGQVGYNFQ